MNYNFLKKRTNDTSSFHPVEPKPAAHAEKVESILERRIKSFFDADYYLSHYPDVIRSNTGPLVHYETHGWKEGRKPNAWYSDSLVHPDLIIKNPSTPLYILFLSVITDEMLEEHKANKNHFTNNTNQLMSFEELYDKKESLVFVDNLFIIDDCHFIIRGWFHPNANIDNDLRFRFGSSSTHTSPAIIVRYPRKDLQQISDQEAEPLAFIMALSLPETGNTPLYMDWIPNGGKPIELYDWTLPENATPLEKLHQLWSVEKLLLTQAFAKFNFETLIKNQALSWLLVPEFEYAFDLAIGVQDSEFLVTGWCVNPDQEITEFFATHNFVDGKSQKLPYSLHKREDLKNLCVQVGGNYKEAGFVMLLPNGYGTAHLNQIEIYASTRCGRIFRLVSKANLHWINKGLPQARIRRILELFNFNQADCLAMLANVLAPAISRLHTETLKKKASHQPIVKRQDFGLPPENPQVSIIVPLYGRYDFAMYQLADFANDPAFRDGSIELLFICDDPTIETDFLTNAYNWQNVYPVPFSIISYSSNLGYAGANNIGAEQAKAGILILLNSDVLPTQSGWVVELTNYLNQHPEVGAVGPMLLFYDGTVQHQGMEYVREKNVWDGLWRCSHPHKGMLPHKENVIPHSVPATTGACLVTRRDLYLRLEGLSEEYILGDFEDSDYCLKTRAAGFDIHLLPQVRLYHIERQSQSLVTGHWKEGLTIYNAWVHQQNWGAVIAALTKKELTK